MVVHVKFMALNEDGEIAAGIIMNCPSIQALRERLEEMDAAIIYAEEATAEEIAEAEELEGE